MLRLLQPLGSIALDDRKDAHVKGVASGQAADLSHCRAEIAQHSPADSLHPDRHGWTPVPSASPPPASTMASTASAAMPAPDDQNSHSSRPGLRLVAQVTSTASASSTDGLEPVERARTAVVAAEAPGSIATDHIQDPHLKPAADGQAADFSQGRVLAERPQHVPPASLQPDGHECRPLPGASLPPVSSMAWKPSAATPAPDDDDAHSSRPGQRPAVKITSAASASSTDSSSWSEVSVDSSSSAEISYSVPGPLYIHAKQVAAGTAMGDAPVPGPFSGGAEHVAAGGTGSALSVPPPYPSALPEVPAINTRPPDVDQPSPAVCPVPGPLARGAEQAATGPDTSALSVPAPHPCALPELPAINIRPPDVDQSSPVVHPVPGLLAGVAEQVATGRTTSALSVPSLHPPGLPELLAINIRSPDVDQPSPAVHPVPGPLAGGAEQSASGAASSAVSVPAVHPSAMPELPAINTQPPDPDEPSPAVLPISAEQQPLAGTHGHMQGALETLPLAARMGIPGAHEDAAGPSLEAAGPAQQQSGRFILDLLKQLDGLPVAGYLQKANLEVCAAAAPSSLGGAAAQVCRNPSQVHVAAKIAQNCHAVSIAKPWSCTADAACCVHFETHDPHHLHEGVLANCP